MRNNDWSVADICDKHPNDFSVLPQVFCSYGKLNKCHGKIATVSLEEDNRKLIELLNQDGSGRIAIVQCLKKNSAVLGDRLATIALDHNWQGVIVDGAIRDIPTLRDMPICIFASLIYPVRGEQNGGGEIGVPLKIGETKVKPNDFIYADEDGVLITANKFF